MTRLQLLTLAVTTIVAAASTVPLRADALPWSADGHRIVCSIAWRNLTTETQVAVQELLATDDSLRFRQFEEACLWADQVRGRDPMYDRFTTAHYMNLSRGDDGVKLDEHCAASLCLVQAIDEQLAILADSTQSKRIRLEALKWVSHFVGDIHQPLHVGYGDDRGGNSIEIILSGEPTTLHGLWDYALIAKAGLPWERYARRLGRDISRVDRRLWTGQTVIQWANESFSISEDTVYEFPIGSSVPDEYYYRNIQTVERQLKKAGLRLAEVLNTALG